MELIKLNAKYNNELIKSQFKVMPLDFKEIEWSRQLMQEIKQVDIVIAADGKILNHILAIKILGSKLKLK